MPRIQLSNNKISECRKELKCSSVEWSECKVECRIEQTAVRVSRRNVVFTMARQNVRFWLFGKMSTRRMSFYQQLGEMPFLRRLGKMSGFGYSAKCPLGECRFTSDSVKCPICAMYSAKWLHKMK
uniref:Uncharacterized protein n=1 Tax=Globodera rostochiensis TaxID=31243 RepID=A0A914HZL4_GLORO